MKKVYRKIMSIVLCASVLLAAVAPVSGHMASALADNSAIALSSNPYTTPEWKRLYFDVIREAITYATEHSWANCACGEDHNEDDPTNLDSFILADLNFDGIPELVMFHGLSPPPFYVSIHTILDSKVFLLYHGLSGWSSYFSSFNLYKRIDDGTPVYRVESWSGNMWDSEGGSWSTNSIHILDSSTRIDEDMSALTEIARYDFWQYADGGFNIHFNGVDVMESELYDLLDGLMSDYEETDYEPALMWLYDEYEGHRYDIHGVSDAEIIDFLDSYMPETTFLGIDTPGDGMQPPDGSEIIYISTAAELAAIGGAQSAGRYYALAADIQVTGSWTPIEDFQGTLDGRGHTITLTHHDGRHYAASGLFGSINGGTVTIKNLQVTTGGGISSSAPESRKSRAYAGALIGIVRGGDVTIENCAFHGSVQAVSSYNRYERPDDFGIDDRGQTAGWFIDSYGGITFDDFMAGSFAGGADMDNIQDNGSRSYAGGFIGFVDGGSRVSIVNSFARGAVRSHAGASVDLGTVFHAVHNRAYSGGFVGYKDDSAALSVTNSYVTNTVEATGTPHLLGGASPDRGNAGAIIGLDGSSGLSGSGVYRLNTQSITGDIVNTSCVNDSLTSEQMQDPASFAGFVFSSNAWAIDTGRNDGYPYPSVFGSVIDSGQAPGSGTGPDSGTGTGQNPDSGSGSGSGGGSGGGGASGSGGGSGGGGSTGSDGAPNSSTVGGTGSTQPQISEVFLNDTRIYADGEALVDAEFVNSIDPYESTIRVVYEDGTVHEDELEIGENLDGSRDTEIYVSGKSKEGSGGFPWVIALVAVVAVLVAAAVVMLILALRTKKKKSHADMRQPISPRCRVCGAEILASNEFCGKCGTRQFVQPKCIACGADIASDAAFCAHCGVQQYR